jgi:hypothetical protein
LSFRVVAEGRTYVDEQVLRGTAQVRGEVVDAVTGQALEGARVLFSFSDVAEAEGPELVAHTGPDGRYLLTEAPTGTFDVAIEADDYARSVLREVSVSAGDNVLPPKATSETLGDGQMRIVLTWGETPYDFDAHLTGPDLDGDRFHVYFSNRAPSDVGATLDRDDMDGFGPETVTITSLRDGTYRYSVFNYSNRSIRGALAIEASPARVEVYDETGLVRTYRPPAAEEGDGNTWHVFELEVRDGVPVFIDGGGRTLGYVMADDSWDMETFQMLNPEVWPVK